MGRGNNEEYLSRVAKLAAQKKWSSLLKAFKAALTKVPCSRHPDACASWHKAAAHHPTHMRSTVKGVGVG